MTLHVKSPITKTKAEYEGCATCVNYTRGVSSHHVLTRAFGDAYMRHENVRHATLLFCALERRALVKTGAGERWENKMSYSVAKVSKVYQEIRAICRKYPECKSLDEAKVKRDLDGDPQWNLTVKEEKALKRMCAWLGL